MLIIDLGFTRLVNLASVSFLERDEGLLSFRVDEVMGKSWVIIAR